MDLASGSDAPMIQKPDGKTKPTGQVHDRSHSQHDHSAQVLIETRVKHHPEAGDLSSAV